ncbi:MAG TPA: glycosyltransferase [Gammaproteobacteria bacterium]|nr:glycosyltransferase [Gammaproteobacteria bacterium]
MLSFGSAAALLAWVGVLVLPWQPHRVRERLEADPADEDADLRNVTVLIPARDEAEVIGITIAALARQGRGLHAFVIDDQSSDGTAEVAARAAAASDAGRLSLRVVAGRALPGGWAGKLWALEQGLAHVERPFTLLLDADIELAPGMVAALVRAAHARSVSLVSIMAELGCATFWERLLAPAFVFFFKLLYPFGLANDPAKRTAAAAGGCMLVRTAELRAIGGFAAIRGAIIDDCTLAAKLKANRQPIWVGVSHSVRSLRPYSGLAGFWGMVSRSAFTQLRYSSALLLLATALLVVTLLLPPIAAASALFDAAVPAAAVVGASAWAAAAAVYWPTVRFYRLPAPWALTLPVAAALFLAMTWSSAFGYWRGTRATWKNRSYGSKD